jgi:protein-tyrosine phosphatase
VAPGVVIGRRLTNREAAALIREEGVTAVLDLTAEFSEVPALRALEYFNVPVLDLTTPTDRQLDAAVAFLRAQAGQGRTVFIHCALGLGRAACVATAYLLSEKLAPSAEAAAECVRSVRPRIVCRDDALGAIRAFCGE